MSRRLLLAIAAACALAGVAQAEPASPGQAASVDVFSGADADHTHVDKLGLDLDWRSDGPESHEGMRLEFAHFHPAGETAIEQLRGYWRFAETSRAWTWDGRLGSDGTTLIGAFDIHNDARIRQEYFLEREIVETPFGLNHGLYYTFGGAAVDLPMGERDNLNLLGAAQDFTGHNIRLHWRGTYVHVLKPDWGLSVQLRVRAFNSSHPGEFDYVSPRWYFQAMPTVQLRRYRDGWRYLLSGGFGAQMQTDRGWRTARALNAQVTSPPTRAGWALDAAFAYSNTPIAAGYEYEYRELRLGVIRTF